MSIKYHIVLLLVFLLLVKPGQAQQVVVSQRCKEAYANIIKLKFDDAQKLIYLEKTNSPGNLFPVYLENYIDFLSLFISEDEELFNKIEGRESDRLDLLDKLPDNNPYKDYLKANIRLQWAVAGLKFQNYFSSAIDIRKSFLLIKSNKEEFPEFKPQLITLGVLHIIIGMVPDQYHWVLSLISLEGTVSQGEEELYQTLDVVKYNNDLSYLKPEVLFYLGFMEMNLGPDENKKQMLLDELTPYTNNNLMLTFLKANMLARSAHNDEALQILENATQWRGYYPFDYLYFLKGEFKLRKLDPGSVDDYKYFIQHFEGENYIKDAWRKIGWSFLIEGDTTTYLKMMKKVSSSGEMNVGSDKEANKEALSGKVPNIILLKARLLFDGGYYDKAAERLTQNDYFLFSSEEKLEQLYRLGRIAQKLKKYDEAISYYKQTIEQGKSSKRYFAGNAALQLGIIYEQKKDFSEAKKYYHLCRNLDFDEYETGIKEKAKQGLSRIEEGE